MKLGGSNLFLISASRPSAAVVPGSTKCADAKAKLTARFNSWEARIQARIAKVNQRPDSAAKAARLTRLQDALTEIDALKAQL
jgi:hypothetical protein